MHEGADVSCGEPEDTLDADSRFEEYRQYSKSYYLNYLLSQKIYKLLTERAEMKAIMARPEVSESPFARTVVLQIFFRNSNELLRT